MDPLSTNNNNHACFANDGIARRNALEDESVVGRSVEPRRMWDLWGNRVVPTWMVCTELGKQAYTNELREHAFFVVSHAWLDKNQRQVVDTAIDGYEWPAIPVDTTMERIRGNEEKEDIRKEEWKLDIPTISAIYVAAFSVQRTWPPF
ncbi:hypothetical protein FRB97_009437 [Tulasnella sp. 331]|nr:hypothetical protein FRB97_009437 [Tulasnella sp. 331]KAG8885844.1 hypothetical protein FRB98_001590 [Tulasnella sp. 332]